MVARPLGPPPTHATRIRSAMRRRRTPTTPTALLAAPSSTAVDTTRATMPAAGAAEDRGAIL